VKDETPIGEKILDQLMKMFPQKGLEKLVTIY
jgi:hypothetical protein